MIIDKEEHRQFLMEAMKNINVPGQFIELAFEVKRAIGCATIAASANAVEDQKTD